jgi:hypothetical protein
MVVGKLHADVSNQEVVCETFESMRSKFLPEVGIHVECMRYTSNSNTLMDMLEDSGHGTVAVLAPMNTGKTTLIKGFLSRLPAHHRILVVTSRRTLAFFLARQFESLGAVNYLDLNQTNQFVAARFVVVQLESLYKIHPLNSQLPFPR